MLNIRMKNQVGRKLLGVTLLSLLVALVGLLLVMQYLATRQVLEWHRQRVELVARLVLAEYQGKIQRVQQAASLLADNPTYGELLAAGNVEVLRSLVTPMMKATGLNILTITDYQGVIEVRAHDPGALGVNISSNPLVRASLKDKEATRMTTWKDTIALSASAPIHYQDKIVGVVLTGVLVDKSFVESLSRPGAEVAIFYGNRLVVNSFKDLPESALNQILLSKKLAASAAIDRIQTLPLGKESYTVNFLPLEEDEEKPWENLIVVGVNRRELEPTLLTLKLVIFGVGGASALIAGLLSFGLSSGMRRQIAHLAEGTRRAAQEELAGAIPVTSRDELGELAESFNAMTRALGDKTRLLQEERDRVAANADFLAMIVHDIKAPLTGVRLTIEALEDDTLPPEIHAKLQGIIQRSEGLLLHLHNVLDLSRFESGRLALKPEAVPPGFVIQRLLHHFGPLAQHEGVALNAPPLPPNLPPILVDEPSLDRVLSNLLVNALAATPDGGRIQVATQALDGGQPGEVEITVADTGCGLGPEEKDHLFEKFRLSRSKADGTGLGLYICKTLVEANHGRLWVESETSRGTTFHLAFPAAAGEAAAAEA